MENIAHIHSIQLYERKKALVGTLNSFYNRSFAFFCFQSESGGTVLSTNWKEIGEKPVEVKPPDGMEFKKWDY